jgi:hypothetical protein
MADQEQTSLALSTDGFTSAVPPLLPSCAPDEASEFVGLDFVQSDAHVRYTEMLKDPTSWGDWRPIPGKEPMCAKSLEDVSQDGTVGVGHTSGTATSDQADETTGPDKADKTDNDHRTWHSRFLLTCPKLLQHRSRKVILASSSRAIEASDA